MTRKWKAIRTDGWGRVVERIFCLTKKQAMEHATTAYWSIYEYVGDLGRGKWILSERKQNFPL